jgi:hypothetical protein
MNTRYVFTWTLALLLAAQVAGAQEHPGHPGSGHAGGHAEGGRADGGGHVLDNRYNHGHYYPRVGANVRVLPEGYHPYFHGGRPYYFYGGVWYAPGAGGFVVVRPPVGIVVSVLPPYYSTVWFAGVPYYYADDVYYTWDPAQNAYVVVEPPADAEAPSAPPPSARDDLIIYPKNGQSSDQQAADKYDCYRWARSQTGFDPTQPGGGSAPGARSNYDRAMSACLTGRGYEVK